MRINGFTQIKEFYKIVFNQKHPFKPQHISLYVFLINQNNRNNWVEWFKCPYDLAMAGACLTSNKTYYKCLNDLKEWELLDYKKGMNQWQAPRIKLVVLKRTSTNTSTDTATVPSSAEAHEQAVIQAVEQLHEQAQTYNIKPITINLLTNNLKPITENLDAILGFLKSKESSSLDVFNIDLPEDEKSYDPELFEKEIKEFLFEKRKYIWGEYDNQRSRSILKKILQVADSPAFEYFKKMYSGMDDFHAKNFDLTYFDKYFNKLNSFGVTKQSDREKKDGYSKSKWEEKLAAKKAAESKVV